MPYRNEHLFGRVVVVSFFATWCVPCILEIPLLKQVQKTHGPKGVQVVGVGMDLEGALVLEPFAEHYELPYPVLVADETVRSGNTPFGPVSVLPVTYIVGRDGKIHRSVVGVLKPDQLEAIVSPEL